jgi:hypothetical protein
MRITSSQLRRIIMEEVANVKRQKNLQERKRLQQRRIQQRRIQERKRRHNRRMMEAYPSFTHPKEQLIAVGIIIAAAVAAGQLNKAFDFDGSQARKKAAEACNVSYQMTGVECDPEETLEAARKVYEDNYSQSAGEDVSYEDNYSTGEFMSDPSSYSDYDY